MSIIFDLNDYKDKIVEITTNNDRKIQGVIDGYDKANNLVISSAKYIDNNNNIRHLGLIILRNNVLVDICILDNKKKLI